MVDAGAAAAASAFVASVLLPALFGLPAAALCCAVAAVGSVVPEAPELSEASAVVCDCAEALVPAAFGVAAAGVGTMGVGVAVVAVVVAVSAVPLISVCTVACGFVAAVALPLDVGWVAPFASAVAAAVVDVAPDVVSLPSAAACDVAAAADADWLAVASAAAAIASGVVLEPPLAAVVGVVGVLVAATVTGRMTAIAVGTMPVVTSVDEFAVEPVLESVVVLPPDDDCVPDVEESSFESAALLRECEDPLLPLA